MMRATDRPDRDGALGGMPMSPSRLLRPPPSACRTSIDPGREAKV